MKRLMFGSLAIILLLVIWQFYANSIDNVYIFPSLVDVGRATLKLLRDSHTYTIIFISMSRLIIAVLISTIMGIFLGLFSAHYEWLEAFLGPIVTTLRTLPVASIIVVVMILIGGFSALYVITFLMLFPLVYEASKHGVKNIDEEIRAALSLEHQRKMRFWLKIDLPLAFPYIKTALIQSFGLGFKVLVMAEFITQAPRSIGKSLYDGSISINYDIVFAWTIIIICIVSIIELMINRLKTI